MEKEAKIQRAFRFIVGTMVLASALLVHYHSQYWLLLTGFIGLNLMQYAFTDWCLMTKILEKAVR